MAKEVVRLNASQTKTATGLTGQQEPVLTRAGFSARTRHGSAMEEGTAGSTAVSRAKKKQV